MYVDIVISNAFNLSKHFLFFIFFLSFSIIKLAPNACSCDTSLVIIIKLAPDAPATSSIFVSRNSFGKKDKLI